MDTSIFGRLESEVRGYCRAFPTVFTRAEGTRLIDETGRSFIDFFAGAGVMNYGHGHPVIREQLVDYLASGGPVHALDMHTGAKRTFLERFEEVVLRPRGLDYKIQFPGPTGTNAIEAALKLARKVTGRSTVVAFTNGYHGVTLGALAATGNIHHRASAGVPLEHIVRLPFDGYFGPDRDTLDDFEMYLQDGSSGIEKPAAVLLETVQAEGGVNPCSDAWLQRLEAICNSHGILLIIDDIQVGCGRTGPFFSFEPAGIQPDIICLSKSISGFGLPMALVLMKPEHDQWSPGEHNGTFRGHNLAFVTAVAALENFWQDDALERAVADRAAQVTRRLEAIVERHPGFCLPSRGRGLIQGLPFTDPSAATRISKAAFEAGLLIEAVGAEDDVLKILPPLVITEAELDAGFDILDVAVDAVAAELAPQPATASV
ncbi:MAG: diaminobutyrate--2-oxoglutarate transaminase [Acidobacteriota bacterium]